MLREPTKVYLTSPRFKKKRAHQKSRSPLKMVFKLWKTTTATWLETSGLLTLSGQKFAKISKISPQWVLNSALEFPLSYSSCFAEPPTFLCWRNEHWLVRKVSRVRQMSNWNYVRGRCFYFVSFEIVLDQFLKSRIQGGFWTLEIHNLPTIVSQLSGIYIMSPFAHVFWFNFAYALINLYPVRTELTQGQM